MSVHRALIATLAMLIASTSLAGLPPPPNVWLPPGIRLVGTDGASADPGGSFTVVVRDLANQPVPGAVVIADFSNCPDVEICEDQLGNSIAHPADRTLSRVTDIGGEASFTILGGGRAVSQPAPVLEARFVVDGVIIGWVPVRCYDLDGASGMNGADLTLWLDDFGLGSFAARSDFDFDGSLGGADLTLWLDRFGAGGSAQSCAGARF